MARLPDRFDLVVRKARQCFDPARQADFVLGALAGLDEWHFLNVGATETPQAAVAGIDGARHLLVFSDLDRIEELVKQNAGAAGLEAISIPCPAAMSWCLERRAGLLVNPGEDAVSIPLQQLEIFYAEWNARGGRQAAGLWIPNMTSEEEDFWRQNGL